MRDLTFYIWADTHYGYQQRFAGDDLRARIIDQMNALPGWPYPRRLGGTVDSPDFVLLCGDAVDGQPGQGEPEMTWFRYFTQRLRFPQVEAMGNHDTDPVYSTYFRDTYGGLSHSFDRQGVHFICLNARYDASEGGSLGQEELVFLQEDLASCGAEVPVILFVHSRLDRTQNGTDALCLLRDHRTLLIASAHIHKPAVFQLDGIDCVDAGQCRDHPIDAECGRVLYVCRLTDSRLTAAPWRWDLRDWEHGQRWADPDVVAGRLTLDREL